MRSIIFVFMVLLLVGCSVPSQQDTIYAMVGPSPPPVAFAQAVPLYPVLGGFSLNENTPTIDALLESFDRNGSMTFKERGFKYSSIQVYLGRAWCDLSFKSGITRYVFGVQLVQTAGGSVVAVVRNMRTVENYPVDYKVLEINPKLYAALLDAQHLTVPTN